MIIESIGNKKVLAIAIALHLFNSDSVDDAVIEQEYLRPVLNIIDGGQPFSNSFSLLTDLEEDIEANVEEDIEADVEEDIEADVEEDIEADVEEDIEADVEEDIEADVEEDIEADVEEDIEADVEEDIEADVEEDIEADVEEDIEADVEDEIETEVESEIEIDDTDNFDDDFDDRTESGDEDNDAVELTEEAIESIQRLIDIKVDYNNYEISTSDWLVLTDIDDQTLVSMGFSIVSQQNLQSLDKQLVRVKAPSTFSFNDAGKQLIDSYNTDGRQVDFNHTYQLAYSSKATPQKQLYPRQVLNIPELNEKTRIGIVDTEVNLQHPSLFNAVISQRGFEEFAVNSPDVSHGTSVASILVGGTATYSGLLENVELYSSSVFFESSGKDSSIATTQSLINALDWHVNNGVRVINMSLAGPPNNVLRGAIEQYCKQGVSIVAAVGNNGPHAPAMYPAAYDCVIGVTAISEQNRIYRRAIRGEHVDISAYGVNVLAASGNTEFAQVSGTSFAAPFVSAYVLYHKQFLKGGDRLNSEQIFSELADLGEPGRDSIYGSGTLPIGHTASP